MRPTTRDLRPPPFTAVDDDAPRHTRVRTLVTDETSPTRPRCVEGAFALTCLAAGYKSGGMSTVRVRWVAALITGAVSATLIIGTYAWPGWFTTRRRGRGSTGNSRRSTTCDRDHAGEPVVRRLLRDVSGRGRYPDDERRPHGVLPTASPSRVCARMSITRRQRRWSPPVRCTRVRHRPRPHGRFRRGGPGNARATCNDRRANLRGEGPHDGHRRDGLPHAKRHPELLDLRARLRAAGPHVRTDASWSLPAHLFMVSEWSADCTRHNVPISA